MRSRPNVGLPPDKSGVNPTYGVCKIELEAGGHRPPPERIRRQRPSCSARCVGWVDTGLRPGEAQQCDCLPTLGFLRINPESTQPTAFARSNWKQADTVCR